jgi:hypothetical protein
MRMEEEYPLKWRMETGLENILDGETKSGKVFSNQSPLDDIPTGYC